MAGGLDPLPLKNHKHIGFLSNTGLDPLKITKHSMFEHQRHASETPFKWWYLDPSSPHQNKTKIKIKKNLSKFDPL